MIPEKELLRVALATGLVSEAALTEAKRMARQQQRSTLDTLCLLQRVPLSSMHRAYAADLGLGWLPPGELKPDPTLSQKLGIGALRSRLVLPIQPAANETQPRMACGRKPDSGVERLIERLGVGPMALVLTDADALSRQIDALEKALSSSPDFTTAAAEAPFDPVNEVNRILEAAYLNRASDVHLAPLRDEVAVRFRVDGSLREFERRYSPVQAASLVSRIKVLAQLDIAETRMPQDGGMRHRIVNGPAFELRVATAPTAFGERVTLRLLGTERSLIDLAKLGMAKDELLRWKDAIAQPHGMVLVTGPTGSGKSTTLYAALSELNSPERNILTAEDPVEMPIPGISQTQIGVKVSFASALRSFLRHDPDVIMVGEIRDSETADIAVKAALTGHLVFSTLHTNSAAAAVPRLRDLGVEPFLIGSTVIAIIAQRLARRLCTACRQPRELSGDEAQRLGLGFTPVTLHEPVGCAVCDGSGYRGRVALFECLWVDDALRLHIVNGAPEQTLEANPASFSSLETDARRKLLAGDTSLAELKRLALAPRAEQRSAEAVA